MSERASKRARYRDMVSVTRPLFFSSTFRDMHSERDMLRNDAFLELGERVLRPRRHELNVIDLRQGVEVADIADETERELAVLKVCLGEIERTRPFLIGLLGDRHGWGPPEERMEAAARAAGFPTDVVGMSVTELELRYAFIDNPEQQQRSRIYIREMDYTGMPDAVRADHDERFAARDGTDEEQRAAAERWDRLEALKASLLKNFPDRVRTYPAGWDAKRGVVTGLEALRAMVVEDLGADLDVHTREYERNAPQTWQEADARLLEDFVLDRTRCFVERRGVTDPAQAFALTPATDAAAQPWGLCLTGESGLGKSAIFSRIYRDLGQKHDTGELLLLGHAAGIHIGSEQVDRMLRRWIYELAAFVGVADPVEAAEAESGKTSPRKYGATKRLSLDDIESMFASLLGRAAAQTRVVLLVDALNQFERTSRGRHLTWLPRPWPANARLVATAIPGDESESLARTDLGRLCEMRPVPNIDESEARAIAALVFDERYHRDVNEPALDALLAKGTPADAPAYGNPLWLDLALQELNLLEGDDFARAEIEFAHLAGAERMGALLVSVAEKLPPTVTEIYGELLARAERTFGEAFTRAMVSFVALGRAGWRESDLEVLVPQETGEPWTDLAFAGVRRSLGRHFILRGEFGLWDFFHARLRDSAMRSYLGDAERQRKLHGQLVVHLESLLPEDPLRLSEIMVHLIGLADCTRAATFLAGIGLDKSGLRNGAHVLAEHIATDPAGLSFARAMLAADGISAEQTHRVANNMQFAVADALEAVAPLGPRFDLLSACRTALLQLAQGEPSNTVWQRSLSVSHSRVGNMLLARGNLSEALSAYRQSLAISEQLAQNDLSNAVWQRDLSVNHNKIGDLLRRQGNLVEALSAYRQSMAIRERLAQSDASNAGWQRDLSVSHDKTGNVLLAQGNLAEALSAYRQSLAIREQLVQSDPSNAVWQRDLSVSHNKIDNVLLAQDNLGEALSVYRQSMAVAEQLVQSDPSNAVWQRDLSVSHDRIGDVLLAQGNLAEALAAFRQALGIREQLARSDPSNAGWQRDLSVSYSWIGNVLRQQGNLVEALSAYRQLMAIAEQLAQNDPSNAGWLRDLWVSCVKMAQVSEESKPEDAQQWWRKAYDTLSAMKARGLHLSPQDEQVLSQLKRKAGG